MARYEYMCDGSFLEDGVRVITRQMVPGDRDIPKEVIHFHPTYRPAVSRAIWGFHNFNEWVEMVNAYRQWEGREPI